MKIRTYTQLEAILRTVFDIEGNNIKDVATIANINLNTLYKWNCGAMHFSPDNIDKLLVYFQEHEPERLDRAERVYDALRGIIHGFRNRFEREIGFSTACGRFDNIQLDLLEH